MHNRTLFVLFLAALLTLGAITSSQAAQVRLSSAASMTDVIRELITSFATTHPEITISPNFGPSGGLAKQIEQGAPADIYISANQKWMQYLLGKNLIAPGTDKVFAHNQLVFIGKEKSITSLADLPKLARIGIGSPTIVPAGQYAAQALTKVGLYQQLLDSGKLVMAKDVRQALIYADRGETDGSFVYATDARLAASATVLFAVPQDLYSPIAYPIGLTSSGAENMAAKAFYDYVGSAEASEVLTTYGFLLTTR